METPVETIAQQQLAEVLERLAKPEPGAGPGGAAALACALAAGLIENAAAVEQSVLSTARCARASALRGRALELADRDRHTYDAVVEAQAMEEDNPQRETRLASARAQAATTPLAIASLGAQLTSLAAENTASESDQSVAHAIVAAELADGACRAAAHLVRLDLQSSPGDPRRTEATSLVAMSTEALGDAFAQAAERSRAG